jgi:hypothetical protein
MPEAITLSCVMQDVIVLNYVKLYAEFPYIRYHYAEFCYAECRYVEFPYTRCHYARESLS